MFQNLKVHQKLLAVTAIPLAIIAIVSLVIFFQNIVALQETKQLSSLGTFAVDISNLVHELQKERGASALNLGTKGGFVTELDSQRKETDVKFTVLQEVFASFNATRFGGGFSQRITTVKENLKKLESIRREVSTLSIAAADMAKYYTSTIANMLNVIEAMNEINTDYELTRQISIYLAMLHEKERSGQERAVAAGAFGAGSFSLAAYNKFVDLLGQQTAFHKFYVAFASAKQIEFYNKTMDAPETKDVERMRKIALSYFETKTVEDVTGAYWYGAITKKINLLKKVEDALALELKELMNSKIKYAYTNLLIVGLVCLLVIVLSVLLTASLVKKIVKPVQLIAKEFSHLAQYDLTRRVDVFNSDEIGNMSGQFNQLVQQLAMIVSSVRQAGSQMATASEELSSTMREMSTMGETQSKSSIQISEAVRDSSKTIQEISHLAESTQRNVENIATSANNATNCMEQLHHNTVRITNVLSVIRDITDQVNLLALNAAIEAARAGDAGRGFAVVADEVRKLASHTTNSTKDIEDAMTDLQEDVKNTGEAIHIITAALKAISDEVKSISLSLTQQSATVEEISSTAVSFSVQTEQMGRSINETEEVSRSIAHEANELDRRVREFKL